jgi:hypothetical protein
MIDKGEDRGRSSARRQNELAVWKQINHTLVKLKISQQNRHHGKVTASIKSGGTSYRVKNLIWGFGQWLQIVWKTYGEVWQLQSQVVSPDFLRVVLRKGILPLVNIQKEPLRSYIETLIFEGIPNIGFFAGLKEPRLLTEEERNGLLNQSLKCFRTSSSLAITEVQADIDRTMREVEKIRIDWKNRVEIEATQLAYKTRNVEETKTTQAPAFDTSREQCRRDELGGPNSVNVEASEHSKTALGEAVKFEHSDDYTWVKIRGKQFTLTPTQASVVQILHESYTRGKPDVSKKSILGKIEHETSRLRDIFKSTRGAWKVLVRSERRGVYRINL